MTRQIVSSRVILIAAPDDEIAGVAKELARIAGKSFAGRSCSTPARAECTCAGSCEGLRRGGRVHASVQSFSGVAAPVLEGRVFAVEGDSLGFAWRAKSHVRSVIAFQIPGAKRFVSRGATMRLRMCWLLKKRHAIADFGGMKRGKPLGRC